MPKNKYDSDRFFRNDNGKFTDVSGQAGIANFGFGLSVSVTDVNGDGWLDIYVGNDFVQPDNLFINNQKGSFSDKLGSYFRHCSMSTMGTELSDFDNDTRVDLMAVDMWRGRKLPPEKPENCQYAQPVSHHDQVRLFRTGSAECSAEK
jgi:hypothetical protein